MLTCCRIGASVGVWRSLVAHLSRGQGVASSNLASPTNSPNLKVQSGKVQSGTVVNLVKSLSAESVHAAFTDQDDGYAATL